MSKNGFAATAVAFAALILAEWLLLPHWLASQIWLVRQAFPYIAPWVIVAGIAMLCLYLYDRKASLTLPILAGAASFVGAIALMVLLPFWNTQTYASSVSISDAPAPSFDIRAPYSVAKAQASSAANDLPGAEIQFDTTRYEPSPRVKDTDAMGGSYNTLVTGRDFLGRYDAVISQKYAGGGRLREEQCRFDAESKKRAGGWFGHNLSRAVNSHSVMVNWDAGDVYAVCEMQKINGKDVNVPLVIVPLKKQTGIFVVTEVPAGAAVYNGVTDSVTIVDDPKQIPGASYPASLARKQQESTVASGSWWEWLMNRVGFETAPGIDAEGANTSDFILQSSEGAAYMTPMRPRGNSAAVTGLAVVSAKGAQPGSLAPVTIHRLNPKWVSLSAIESRIRADYQNIPNLQEVKVQEILPVDGNQWTAMLGNEENLQWVIRGRGDLRDLDGLKDAATCLYSWPNMERPIQCGKKEGRNGAGVGVTIDSGDPKAPPAPQDSGDLEKLTPQELADLQARITAEWLRRSAE